MKKGEVGNSSTMNRRECGGGEGLMNELAAKRLLYLPGSNPIESQDPSIPGIT